MDIEEVNIFNKEFNITNALSWCKENNISIIRYWTLHSENTFGRGIIYGFRFSFMTKEDAVAFKLRWL